MDFIDQILEALRGGDGKHGKPAPAPAPADDVLAEGSFAATHPGYAAYRRMEEAEGNPVKTEEEYLIERSK